MRTITSTPRRHTADEATILSCSECATGQYDAVLRRHPEGHGYACTNPTCHHIVHPADFQFDAGEVLTRVGDLLAYFTPEPYGYCRTTAPGHPPFAHTERPTCEDFDTDHAAAS